MKSFYMCLVMFCLAINLELLLADEEQGEGTTTEASETTEGEITTEGETTTEGDTIDKGETTTESEKTEGESSSEGRSTTDSTSGQQTKAKVKSIDPKSMEFNMIMKNLSSYAKYLDPNNKETQKFVSDITSVFGNHMSMFVKCLGGEWMKRCRFEVLKCTSAETPYMCLWLLACDESNKCNRDKDRTTTTTTTSATTLSPGRALLRNALKAASGLQCSKLKQCLKDMGFSLAKFLQNMNSNKLNEDGTTSKPTRASKLKTLL